MKANFYKLLQQELHRVDAAKSSKRNEKIIEKYTHDHGVQAIIKGRPYVVFNSNDYLGLRFQPELARAERHASETFGTGPGAVRFISGTMKIYKELEKSLAKFHGRDDAMVFSSAFAANLAVIFCLIKGQSKDSLVSDETLVLSDELNHRSIIDGIRVANLPSGQRKVWKHLDYDNLKQLLEENASAQSEEGTKFKRVVLLTDGVFSMIGEYVNLEKVQQIASQYDSAYEQGVVVVVDDSHGVGAFGKRGRGVEDVTNVHADVLIGTMGKAFGADGGYVVANQVVIDYLRESAATYIYSNSISPGVAAAAHAGVQMVDTPKGQELMRKLKSNIAFFKRYVKKAGLQLAADSIHPIQPLLIGDTKKSSALMNALFEKGILVTAINYPVVPPGRDEIRIQLNASHTQEDIKLLIDTCKDSMSNL